MYVKLKSWHINRDHEKVLCGKKIEDWHKALTTLDIPLTEKSCETCLRLDKSLLDESD